MSKGGHELTLYYFNVRGRAEPIRLMLQAAGMPFKDRRMTREECEIMKKEGTAPFGQLPFIELKNGRKYGESKAIANYVARTCCMMGKTEEDALKVDEVACLVGSLMDHLGSAYYEQDPARQERMWSTVMNETVPKYVEFFENLLEGDCHYVPGSLSMADLMVYDMMEKLLKFAPAILDKCPHVAKLREEVERNANIKAYLQTRPQTDN